MAVKKRIYESGNICWSYRFDAPGSTDKDRKQLRGSGYASKKEAEVAEAERRLEAQEEFDRKIEQATPRPKALSILLDEFLTDCAKRLAPKTVERYRQMVPYLDAGLVATPMVDVTAQHLAKEWQRLLVAGGRTRKGEVRSMKPKTVRNIAGMVSAAYSRAIRWGWTTINPVKYSDPPTHRGKRGISLTPEQQRLVVESASGPWCLGSILQFCAATGCRRGEALALRWSDLVGDEVFIERSLCQTKAGLEFKGTKTGKVRKICMPSDLVEAISRHRIKQDELKRHFRQDYQRGFDLVFCDLDGSPLRPDSVSASVSALCKRLKLPSGVSLHTLRHTHGSMLLASGMELSAISERLGHSSMQVTAEVYSHAVPGRDREAARKWQEFQGKPETSKRQ